MDLVTPDIGLVFWTTLAFLFLLVLLRVVAWKPILAAVKEREESIKSSLEQADQARAEMANLKAENEKILKEAKEERAEIVKDAKALADGLVKEAKDTAKAEASKIMEEAKRAIQTEKMAAITEVKNEVGEIAIKIAEQILRKQLEGKEAQEKYVAELVEDFKLN